MSVSRLLTELRHLDIRLDADNGSLLVDAPTGTLADELKTRMLALKPALLRVLEEERRACGQEDGQGLVQGWSEEPGWIVLRDPTTGECHEWPAADCLPSIVEEANRYQEEGDNVNRTVRWRTLLQRMQRGRG